MPPIPFGSGRGVACNIISERLGRLSRTLTTLTAAPDPAEKERADCQGIAPPRAPSGGDLKRAIAASA
jgi:hypothetical protein